MAPSEKQIKASIKEGGKKGVDLAGMCDMGGVMYFHVKVDTPKGNFELLKKVLEGANAQVDESAEERKGGAGHLGKCFFCADDEKVMYVIHVPKALADAKELDANTWYEAIAKEVPGELQEGSDDETKLVIAKKDADKGLFPLKMVDALPVAGCALLRSKGLLPDESDSDSDYCPGDVADDLGVEW